MLLQFLSLDIPAIIGIILGFLGTVIGVAATSRANKLTAKISETSAVLNAWKDFSTAQAAQAELRAKERLAQTESQDRRIEILEGKLETAVLKFNECEKKHAKLEGKFESLGVTQATQNLKLNAQGMAQDFQSNRQDVQETRQNEQEERQNFIELKVVDTVESVVKSKPDAK